MRYIQTLFLILMLAPAAPAQQPVKQAAEVDSIFERWDSTATPGCSVAVARNGRTVFSRAYGMADLEHDLANTPTTIFEAGSVSKQFTAAAIVLLAQQGKLSVNDDVRKYVPEVPEYGSKITIRHMMTHTSGLRDWGSVAGISGWGRGSRVHTHEHVLEIVNRQSALNFTPGDEYSYSNTGYNLQAVIVSRLSGMTFAEFTKKNLFEPLGMTSTQWRDDYKRIVKNRAVAYESRRGGGLAIDMPYENVHGNGGLLTTVGDLLVWTENLETGKLGGSAFKKAMHWRGRLNNGQQIAYASGLRVTNYKGIPEISHTGSTAGYRAFLARYLNQRLAVALLCNAGNVNSGRVGHQVAEVFLGDAVSVDEPTTPPEKVELPEKELRAKAGLYRGTSTNQLMRLVFLNGLLRIERGGELMPLSSSVFQVGSSNRRLSFEPSPGKHRPRIRASQESEEEEIYEPLEEFAPTTEELAVYAGEYYSADAETTLTAVVENGGIVLRRRPNTKIQLTPLYLDTFQGSLGMIRFLRDPSGHVNELSIRQSRVYDMRFERKR